MLSIRNLAVSIPEGNSEKRILKGLDLQIGPGEVHAIMGPNGSGKSTLAATLAGRDGYTVESGDVEFLGHNLLEMEPDERAREGLFLAFQYPVEIPGVSVTNFLKAALNERRKHQGLDPLDARQFLVQLKENMAMLEMDPQFMSRSLNEGFSGGEKKRNEVLQMTMLQPRLSILDETDSGLDIDALKIVSKGVNALRNENNSFLVITHYQRLLNYIVPDFVHVLYNGRIVQTGGKELALELEARGYDWIREAHEALS